MADFDPLISNGTCYWRAGEEANPRFIPCGNAAFGTVPCCESGDNCLTAGSCYNSQYLVTYVAGCTDSEYHDNNCPNKGLYTNQSWTGLVYCNGTPYSWTGCANPKPQPNADIATVGPVVHGACWCPSTSAEPLFKAAATLASYMRLPASTGMTYDLLPGFTDNAYQSTTIASSTISSTMISSNSESLPQASATSSPTSSSSASPSPTSSSPSHTSTATIAGASSGGAIAFLLLLALFITLMQRHFRKQRESASSTLPTDNDNNHGGYRPESKVYTDDLVGGVQPTGGLPSPSYKSELPAESVTVSSPSFKSPSTTRFSEFGSVQSEVEGSPVVGNVPGRQVGSGSGPGEKYGRVHGVDDSGLQIPGQNGTYYEMSA